MYKLATLSLGNRALIALITVFVAVFGVVTMGSLKQELIPSLEFPQITVVSSMPGASPEVVNKQVSEPLERALNAVEGLESSSAVSRTGFSAVDLTFAYGTDLDRARAQVDRAISNAEPILPEDVTPTSLAGSVADFPVVYMAVSSDKPLNELKADLERLSIPRLQKIEGVRSAEVTGGATQHIAVLPDSALLAANGLSVADVTKVLEANGGLFPVGTLTEDGQTRTVQAGSPVATVEDLAALPLKGSGGVVSLGEVAAVSIADDEAASITRTNGVETLAVALTKTPDGDTVAISHALQEQLADIEAELGSGARFTVVFDQAPFIEQSIEDLTTEGLLGLGFAVLIILVFLLSVRSTLVTAVSIPLSLLATFIGLRAFGYSLNILTLGALTIAIGRVVDDSIVVIENIKRHQGYGEPKRQAIVNAVREVATAVTASTLTTVAVFAPIAFVSGLSGELFRPFAVTVTVALLASLLVSLTIVPVLAYWFLRRPRTGAAGERKAAKRGVPRGPDRLQRGYLPVLQATQKHPVRTLTAAVLILGGTAAMTPLVPTNLLSGSGQNSFTIKQTLPPGSSIANTQAAAQQTEQALDGMAGIGDVQVTIGNATGGLAAAFAGGTDVAQFTVTTDPDADQEALMNSVQEQLDNLRGAGDITVSEQSGGPGTGSSTVEVNVTAPTPELLRAANDQVLAALSGIPGTNGAASNLSAAQPSVEIRVDRRRAADLGLSEEQIGAALAGTVSPVLAGEIRLGYTDYPILVGEGTDLTSVEQLRSLPIPAVGGVVPLSAVAAVEEVESLSTLTSSNGERTAQISVTPTGNDLGAVSEAIAERLAALELPAGTAAEQGGASAEQTKSFNQLYLALLAAVAIVYVIMVATFKSLVQPLILLVSVPFAATGAIGLLLLTGIPLGLPSLIGMLMLVGIVVTNAIVLIDLINQYRKPHGNAPALPVAEAIEQGARRRLRPILMTALATIFALTPMALGLTGQGGFISQPLAVVVIGGLISSTALTLILVPVLYLLVEGRREKRAGAAAADGAAPAAASAAPPEEPESDGQTAGDDERERQTVS